MTIAWNATLLILVSHAHFGIGKEARAINAVPRLADEGSCSTEYSLGMEQGNRKGSNNKATREELSQFWSKLENGDLKKLDRELAGRKEHDSQAITQQVKPSSPASQSDATLDKELSCPLVLCILSPCPQPSCQPRETDEKEPKESVVSSKHGKSRG